jgi:acyl-CoA dehydrogenase
LPEHEELQLSVRAFFERVAPESVVRTIMATSEGIDPALWRTATTELGLTALLVPEKYGGAGCSLVELGIVLEEAGRCLLPSPSSPPRYWRPQR